LSDYEHHKGTLTPVREDLSPAEFAEIIYDGIPKYYDSKLELLLEDNEYYVTKDLVYTINDTKHTKDEWYDARKNNGIIEYDVKFYNGSCGFHEALDTAIKDMKI